MIRSYEKRLAAQFLRRAAEEFSNHGCNDYSRAESGLDSEEWDAFLRRVHRWAGTDADDMPAHGHEYAMDWMVMEYLAHLLEDSK